LKKCGADSILSTPYYLITESPVCDQQNYAVTKFAGFRNSLASYCNIQHNKSVASLPRHVPLLSSGTVILLKMNVEATVIT
jgi:hypothetical protein